MDRQEIKGQDEPYLYFSLLLTDKGFAGVCVAYSKGLLGLSTKSSTAWE